MNPSKRIKGAFEDASSVIRKETISGVELVTIPVSHYAELLDYRRRFEEREISHNQFERPSRSRLDRNPEVAVFLIQRLGLEPIKDILRNCRRTFGAARTPSRTAIYRYWQKLQIEARKSR